MRIWTGQITVQESVGHGSCIRRLSEMNHVQKIFQLGIRGISSSKKEDVDAAREYGSVILSPRQMRKMGIEQVLELIPAGEKYLLPWTLMASIHRSPLRQAPLLLEASL